jgi:hypothetical protein
MNNEKQIATAILMYAQDHEELLPNANGWAGTMNLDKGVLQCPTAGTKIANAYGYNAAISGLALGELVGSPSDNVLVTDALSADNLVVTPADIDTRHFKKAMLSYVDGHVELSSDFLGAFSAQTGADLFANATTLTANEMQGSDVRRGIDWLTTGNGWTTYLNSNTQAGYMRADGGNSGSGHHWVGIYLTNNATNVGGKNFSGTKTLWIRSWESLVNEPNYFRRTLTTNTTTYAPRSNVIMWVMGCDFGWAPNNTPTTCAGNWESKLNIHDASGNLISNFHWFIDDNGYTGDDGSGYFRLNSYNFTTPRPTPYASNPANTWQAPVFAALWPMKHLKIVCAGGKLFFSYGNLSCTTAATGQWQNPGYLYGETWHYSPAGYTVIQNLKYTDVLTRSDVGKVN